MSQAVKQFHEEEQIGKTYDWQVAKRLLRYLKPYLRLLSPALILTLFLNLLGILQPKFTQYAIDWYIVPRTLSHALNATFIKTILGALTISVTAFAAIYALTLFLRFVFSYFQSVLLNSIGQCVIYDLGAEIYEKVQRQEVGYYDRNPVGRIMTRLTADVDALN